MGTLHHLHAKRLLSLAKRMQITDAAEASGHCLGMSLEFAAVAKHLHGIDVELVKWSVVDDPCFVDHWAVRVGGDTIVDLTHVQVDGTEGLAKSMTEYPRNYVEPRVYPVSLLLDIYMESQRQTQGGECLTSRFMWACGVRLLGFDLKAAWGGRDVRRAFRALREGGRFIKIFTLQLMVRWLQRQLEKRLRRVTSRLHESQGGTMNEPLLEEDVRRSAWGGLR